jgi:hypothetical protein
VAKLEEGVATLEGWLQLSQRDGWLSERDGWLSRRGMGG